MKEDKKKLLEQEEKELAELDKEDEKWKQERIKAGNLFTGYDKVSTKSKMKLLYKLWGETKDHDEKLVLDDLMRDVEKTKLGITLNYHYVDEKLEKSDTVFVEQKDLSLNPKEKEPNHLIIEGDNMHSLTALKNTKQEVDVVYIDPPYNTGKEFAYNDKLVSGDDQQKHSKWLSFMKQRLELAKDIMSEEGVIFLSIDDHEQAYLKVLMDEIFGEKNFITNFSYKRGVGANLTKYVRTSREYVLAFAKNKPKFTMNPLKTNKQKGDSSLSNPKINKRSTLFFPENTINFLFDNKFNDKPIRLESEWKWSQKKLDYELKKGTKIIAKTKELRLRYIKNEISKPMPENDISDKTCGVKTNLDGSVTLNKLSLTDSFETPKSTSLIKWLIDRHINKNATVLDFFAGSGTTGQAVMELNQEDGGNRRFILCTNNERTGVDTINHPEKGIARAICRERIHRVINGEGSKGEKITWIYSDDVKSLKNNNVRYLKTELVNKRRELEEQTKKGLTPALFFTKEQRNLYKQEFDTDSIEVLTDFKKRKKIKKHRELKR